MAFGAKAADFGRRAPLPRDSNEHPRVAVTIPRAILVRILRDHLGPATDRPPPRQWRHAAVAQRGCTVSPRHHDRREATPRAVPSRSIRADDEHQGRRLRESE